MNNDVDRLVNYVQKFARDNKNTEHLLKLERATSEHYASLWNNCRSELHKANVRIKRLQEELKYDST